MKIIALFPLLLAVGCATQPLEIYEVAFATASPTTGYSPPIQPILAPPPHRTELNHTELSQCIALDRSAKDSANIVVASNPDLERRHQQIIEEQRSIEAQRATLDTRNPAQVHAFNRRVADLAAFTVEYNASSGNLQGDSDAVNRRVAEYNHLCAGRPYRRADMATLTGNRDYQIGGPRR